MHLFSLLLFFSFFFLFLFFSSSSSFFFFSSSYFSFCISFSLLVSCVFFLFIFSIFFLFFLLFIDFSMLFHVYCIFSFSSFFVFSCERTHKKTYGRDFPQKERDTANDAPLHTDQHGTSWRSDVPPPCLGGASHGWVPVNTHGTPVLTSARRPWVAQPRPRALDTGHRHKL